MHSRNTHVPAPGPLSTLGLTLATSAALVVAGLAAPAMAAEVSSGNDKVSLTLSGQVNRGVLFVDDGTDTEVLHVDNDNSSTRFRMIGKGSVNEDVTVGTQVEVQFESQSTANVKIDDAGFGDAGNFTERKLEFYVDSKRYGRLWLGQGDTASNGTSEVDLSGTTVVAYSGIGDMSGGIEFRDGGALPNRADTLVGADVTESEIQRINKVFSNFDGLSRTDRIRYDTPTFGGIKLSVSNTDGDTNDVAARFSGDIGAGLKLVAAVAWAQTSSLDSQINGSASVLHESGISLTAAGGTRERANPNAALLVDDGGAGVTLSQTEDPTFFYVKLGYQFGGDGGLGKTALAIDFTQVNDLVVDDDEFTAFGAFIVQKIDSAGTELYLGLRQHQLDRTLADFDDISSVLAGARVKF